MIELSLSILNSIISGPGSIALSDDKAIEGAPPGSFVGALTVSRGGSESWNFNLIDDAGGCFAIAGADVVVGPSSLDHTNVPKLSIVVQATNGSLTLRSTFAITVRVRSFGLPQTGDLVFGAQGNMGYPVRAAATQNVVVAGRETLMCETWLPAQPTGARVIYADNWGRSDGVAPTEVDLVNGETINWSSLVNTVNGNTRRADVTFSEFGLSIAGGGFTISDPIGVAIADGNALRTVITAPLGGQRMASAAPNYSAIGEKAASSATLSTFDSARTGAWGSAGYGSVFNLEGFGASGIIAPMTAGQCSFLLVGTSIMRAQDTSPRYILSSSRNAFGYLPCGLDQASNGRMGWWQAAVNGQMIATQNDDAQGKFRRRFAILEAIALKNGGRWPMTGVIIDLRNDFVQIDGASAAEVLRLWIAKAAEQVAAVAELFRGVPIYLVDMPPIAAIMQGGGGFQAARYGTELALQIPPAGSYKAAAVKLFNAWIATNFASVGAAGVCPAGSAACAPDDGSSIAKWRLTPFTAAGGGTIAAADYPSGLAAAVNVSTTGIIVTSATAPEIGAYLALFDVGLGNPESIGGNANTAGAYVTSVAVAGAGKWLVKTSSGTTARARAAGSIVRTIATQDGTHPSHWLHMGPMADAVVNWKGAI